MYFSGVFVALLAFVQYATAMPAAETQGKRPEVRDGQTGRLIQFAPGPTDTGLKRIPDAAHPFIAPGPGDMRGPCPALNTLANHGYIPRNGVMTPEQAVAGITEAFNMQFEFARFLVSFATLARGNAFIGKLSIGGPSPLVPPLPGKIDGPVAGGLATHGRFEGDVSSTRFDTHVGDHVNFQELLFDNLLLYVGKYGEDGPNGPMSVVTTKAFQEFKINTFARDRAEDSQLEFHVGRQLTTFSEVSVILNLWANGTDGKLSMQAMGSIFRNQTFAPNWFRRSSPAAIDVLGGTAVEVRNAGSFPVGANKNGRYVLDKGDFSNFSCAGYEDLIKNQVAGVLMKEKGILAQNVQTLVEATYVPFRNAGCKTKYFPQGKAGL